MKIKLKHQFITVELEHTHANQLLSRLNIELGIKHIVVDDIEDYKLLSSLNLSTLPVLKKGESYWIINRDKDGNLKRVKNDDGSLGGYSKNVAGVVADYWTYVSENKPKHSVIQDNESKEEKQIEPTQDKPRTSRRRKYE